MNLTRLANEHKGEPDLTSGHEELSDIDALFAMLDGQIIRGLAGAWRAEVLSIVRNEGSAWIQLGQAGRPTNSVMVRLPDGLQGDAAIAALRAWTDLPEALRPARIEIAPAAHVAAPSCPSPAARLQARIDQLENNRLAQRSPTRDRSHLRH